MSETGFGTAKQSIREKVWARLAGACVARFPEPYGRVPNFLGLDRCVSLLGKVPLWKRAEAIMFDASAPQLALRRAALMAGKTIYLRLPGLKTDRCFLELDPARLGHRAWRAATLRGAMMWGKRVAPSDVQPFDLMVVGSVGVTTQGARIGTGRGWQDLEYAILRQSGTIRESTPIITAVHPLQVIEDMIPMRANDIPVDLIITPARVVATPALYPRPHGIQWHLLSEERINAIPVLRRARSAESCRRNPRRQ